MPFIHQKNGFCVQIIRTVNPLGRIRGVDGFLSSAGHKEQKVFWRTSYWHSSKYLPLCSAEERNSYRFETTWGQV